MITGNLVLLGIAALDHRGTPTLHVGLAILGYGLGAVSGAMIAGRPGKAQPTPGQPGPGRTVPDRGGHSRTGSDSAGGETTGAQSTVWPRRVCLALLVELGLLATFVAAWQPGPRATLTGQLGLIALATVALGIQSAAVNRLALPGFATTFLTSTFVGTLTALVAGDRRKLPTRFAALAAVVAGAAAGATVLRLAPRLTPLVPTVLLAAVLMIALVSRRAAGR